METNMIQTNIVQNLSNNLNFHLLIIWSFWQVEEMVDQGLRYKSKGITNDHWLTVTTEGINYMLLVQFSYSHSTHIPALMKCPVISGMLGRDWINDKAFISGE